MNRKLVIFLKRMNNKFCRSLLDECGYCGGHLYWLPDGVSVCQECRRRD